MTIVILGAAILVMLATAMGFFSDQGWLCELASHFRVQYAWILSICSTGFFIAHQPLVGILAVGAALVNIRTILPLYTNGKRCASGPTIRVLLANILKFNHAYDRVWQVVREVKPDVIILEETDAEWVRASICAHLLV